MFSAEDDCAFITTMGFDVATFNYILTAFQVKWDFAIFDYIHADSFPG